MRKNLLLLIIGMTLFNFCKAQELGARFGDVSGGNVAIDAVFGSSKYSRIHADVSFGKGVGIDLLFDFAYRPLGGEAFSWYAGIGPYTRIDDPFYLGIVGELGLEYKFNSIPIVIGGDWRPGFSIIETTDFFGGGFGVNVRYVFGN